MFLNIMKVMFLTFFFHSVFPLAPYSFLATVALVEFKSLPPRGQPTAVTFTWSASLNSLSSDAPGQMNLLKMPLSLLCGSTGSLIGVD